MRILVFVVLILCLTALSVYRSRNEAEQRKLQQLTTSYALLKDRSLQLHGAVKAINEIETVKKNSEVRSGLETALQQADDQKRQIQTEISNLPKPPPMLIGVEIVGDKAGNGDSPQVRKLTEQLAMSESQQQSIRDKIAAIPTTSPDSSAIKNVVLQSTGVTATQSASGSSSVGIPMRIFWVRVGFTLVFGLASIWIIVRKDKGREITKNREWAFATVGTIVGFWLKG